MTRPLLAILLAALSAHAQEIIHQPCQVLNASGGTDTKECWGYGLPDRPLPTVRVKLIDEAVNKPVWMTLPVKRRTADRAWMEQTAGAWALLIADNENTQWLLGHGGREDNPLLGTHPSRARMYAEFGIPLAFANYVSYRAKREQDAAKAFGAKSRIRDGRWWIPDALSDAEHVFGIVWTLAATGK